MLDLISWLDRECAEAPPASLPQQLLARSILAAGYKLIEQQNFAPNHPVRETIQAAEQYVMKPTEDNFSRYVQAATDSYPFGSGDGCLAVAELGYRGCEVGSGCRSGSGSLNSLAAQLGDEVVMQAIATELIPWLQGEGDPVADR